MEHKYLFFLSVGVFLTGMYGCQAPNNIGGADGGGGSIAMAIPNHQLSDAKAKDRKYVLNCGSDSFTVLDKDVQGKTKLEFTGTDKISDGTSCSMQIKGLITDSFLKDYSWPKDYTANSERVIFDSGSEKLSQRRLKLTLKPKYTVSGQNAFSITIKKIETKDTSIPKNGEIEFTNVTCPEVNVTPVGSKGWGPVTFNLPDSVFASVRECTFSATLKNPSMSLQGKLAIGKINKEYEVLEVSKVASNVASGSIEVDATVEMP